jgi:hypothetical protein
LSITGSLNGARGNLRSRLLTALERPFLEVVDNLTCKSKKDVLWAYSEALVGTGAWPVEVKSKFKSVSELHTALAKFKYEDPHPCEAQCSCMDGYSTRFNNVVGDAIVSSRKQFNGLCLGMFIMIMI